MEFQSGMRAATANVTVHAIIYFIDFLNLKKITFIENKTSTQTFLWKRSKRLRLVYYAAKKFGKSMVLFCEILLSKNGTALSTGTVLNYFFAQFL
jgi:hypothetical protein